LPCCPFRFLGWSTTEQLKGYPLQVAEIPGGL
jgi:hypothetical protein